VFPSEGKGTVTVSGLINNPTFSGNVIVGNDLTVSGDINASGVTISGITGLFASGTEAAPSISFVDDTDTGFYNAAANEVRITTSGNDRLTVDSAGNIGIGTTAPGAKLDVANNAGTGFINLVDIAAISASQNPLVRLIGRNAANTATTSVDFYKIYQGGFTVGNNDTAASNYTSFNVGASERIRIDSAGRLLVGTSSASVTPGSLTAKFQVQGTSTFDTGVVTALWEASSNPALLHFAKSRGASLGTQTVVQNGDNLGRILFAGSDGTDFETAAWIQGEVDGTPGANDMPGRLVFSTTADGADAD
jgi:hypothetical protein